MNDPQATGRGQALLPAPAALRRAQVLGCTEVPGTRQLTSRSSRASALGPADAIGGHALHPNPHPRLKEIESVQTPRYPKDMSQATATGYGVTAETPQGEARMCRAAGGCRKLGQKLQRSCKLNLGCSAQVNRGHGQKFELEGSWQRCPHD